MKTKLNVVLLLALSVGVFGKLAVAQSWGDNLQGAQMQYAVFHPGQTNPAMQLVAEKDRDRDRCDGDHDRDDRGCGWRNRDRDRDRDGWRWRERRYPSGTTNNGYWGNKGNWRNNNGNWGRNNGWYGNQGNWRNNGYYGNTANGGYRNDRRGEYDWNGDFHPFGSNGYYDRNGKWHNGGGWWR